MDTPLTAEQDRELRRRVNAQIDLELERSMAPLLQPQPSRSVEKVREQHRRVAERRWFESQLAQQQVKMLDAVGAAIAQVRAELRQQLSQQEEQLQELRAEIDRLRQGKPELRLASGGER